MLFFKNFELPLAKAWSIDVIVTDNQEMRNEFCQTRYGWSADTYEPGHNYVSQINEHPNSKVDNNTIIVLGLENLKDKHVMIHELTHVLNYCAKYVGFELSWESQEWQACFMEELWIQLTKTDYTKIEKL